MEDSYSRIFGTVFTDFLFIDLKKKFRQLLYFNVYMTCLNDFKIIFCVCEEFNLSLATSIPADAFSFSGVKYFKFFAKILLLFCQVICRCAHQNE